MNTPLREVIATTATNSISIAVVKEIRATITVGNGNMSKPRVTVKEFKDWLNSISKEYQDLEIRYVDFYWSELEDLEWYYDKDMNMISINSRKQSC